MDQDKLASRFITRSDGKVRRFVFDLPAHWWSRPYEYSWASEFAEPEDVALDAGSGLCHPLKFFLSNQCREVHACDIDGRILLPREIEYELVREFGPTSLDALEPYSINRIQYAEASTMSLPYGGRYFDKIYCISVLEHLDDFFNNHLRIHTLSSMLRPFFPHEIERSLREFKRVLKKDGLIVLTFDYPRIDLGYFRYLVKELGFKFAGETSFEVPETAIFSDEKCLYCFRAVLSTIAFK